MSTNQEQTNIIEQLKADNRALRVLLRRALTLLEPGNWDVQEYCDVTQDTLDQIQKTKIS